MARILVVGGSLAGLMAANLLQRDGHDVLVLERAARSLQGRGAGIVTHANLRAVLRQAGVAVDENLGVAVAERVVLAADGSTQCRWPHPQILTSWGRLYALLRAALPDSAHRLGAAVQSVLTDSASQAVVTLADGSTLPADLVLAADGIRSTLRAQLLPQVQPQYAGYVAWRGVCDEGLLSQRTRRTLVPHFGFGLPPGEQMLGYPVAGAGDELTPGQRRWNFVWYRPAAGAALDALLTDADGVHHPEGIPPQQVSWRHVAAMREAACQLLAPQFAEIVQKTALPFLQPIHDLASPQLAGLGNGRVALLGDAACVARPHVGMGVSKAGDDALALRDAIRRHGATPAALQAYEAARRLPALAIVERARALGAYLQAAQRQAPREAEQVMRQTAVDTAFFDHPHPQEAQPALRG